MISKSLKYYSEMVCMILRTAGIEQKIIYEDYVEHVQVLFEHVVHQVYENFWDIGKTKRYDLEFKVTIPSMESCFQNVTFSDSELMIAGFEVYLREITVTLKFFKQVINYGKRILVLDSDLFKLTVVYAHSERTIFFAHE
ncbi:hypothetical protein CQW23_28396 [Capsicum baccatum]|uniref:Uncharacterized protein n=1 Tax=Capsicum baccatum TaxID=33114 RepID=A0A2G2VGI6_CAPBA|nr:hypothetical protein CQW23_28396 [Capsicum baccatum]